MRRRKLVQRGYGSELWICISSQKYIVASHYSISVYRSKSPLGLGVLSSPLSTPNVIVRSLSLSFSLNSNLLLASGVCPPLEFRLHLLKLRILITVLSSLGPFRDGALSSSSLNWLFSPKSDAAMEDDIDGLT